MLLFSLLLLLHVLCLFFLNAYPPSIMSSIYGGTNVSVTGLLIRVTFHEAVMSKKETLFECQCT